MTDSSEDCDLEGISLLVNGAYDLHMNYYTTYTQIEISNRNTITLDVEVYEDGWKDPATITITPTGLDQGRSIYVYQDDWASYGQELVEEDGYSLLDYSNSEVHIDDETDWAIFCYMASYSSNGLSVVDFSVDNYDIYLNADLDLSGRLQKPIGYNRNFLWYDDDDEDGKKSHKDIYEDDEINDI